MNSKNPTGVRRYKSPGRGKVQRSIAGRPARLRRCRLCGLVLSRRYVEASEHTRCLENVARQVERLKNQSEQQGLG